MALFGQDRPQIGGGWAALGELLGGRRAHDQAVIADAQVDAYRAQGLRHSAQKALEEAGMARNQRIAMEGIKDTLQALGENPALGGIFQASSGGNADQMMQALLGGREFGVRNAAQSAALGGDLAGANARLMSLATAPQELTKVSGGMVFNPLGDPSQSMSMTPLGASEVAYDQARIAKTMRETANVGQGGAHKPPADPTVVNALGAAPMKLTEVQSKDINYFTRGNEANKRLQQSGTNLTFTGGQQGARGVLDNFVRGVPFVGDSGMANLMVSPEYQLAEQDGREFLAAILRKDTGAAITNQEMEIYGKMYLPQPGDPPELLAQKARSREIALKALEAGLGAARGAVPDIEPMTPLGVAPALPPLPALPAQGAAAPPPGAIQKLRANPGLAGDFDAKYGAGAAARFLTGG